MITNDPVILRVSTLMSRVSASLQGISFALAIVRNAKVEVVFIRPRGVPIDVIHLQSKRARDIAASWMREHPSEHTVFIVGITDPLNALLTAIALTALTYTITFLAVEWKIDKTIIILTSSFPNDTLNSIATYMRTHLGETEHSWGTTHHSSKRPHVWVELDESKLVIIEIALPKREYVRQQNL